MPAGPSAPKPSSAPPTKSAPATPGARPATPKSPGSGPPATKSPSPAPKPTPADKNHTGDDNQKEKEEAAEAEEEKPEDSNQADDTNAYDANFWDELQKLLEEPPPRSFMASQADDSSPSARHSLDPEQLKLFADQLRAIEQSFNEVNRQEQNNIKTFCAEQKSPEAAFSKQTEDISGITKEFTDYLKEQDKQNKDPQNQNTKYSDAINKLNSPDAHPKEKSGAYKILKEGMNNYIKDKILNDPLKSTSEKLQENKGKLQQLAKLDKEIKEGMKDPGNTQKQGIFSKLAEQMKDPSKSMREGPQQHQQHDESAQNSATQQHPRSPTTKQNNSPKLGMGKR